MNIVNIRPTKPPNASQRTYHAKKELRKENGSERAPKIGYPAEHFTDGCTGVVIILFFLYVGICLWLVGRSICLSLGMQVA